MQHKYFGGDVQHQQSANQSDVAAMVERVLRPLAASVGLDDAALAAAVDRDVSRRVAKAAFDTLEAEGVQLLGARVLDLGAGLGHASVEAVTRGCELTAIEPGIEWCGIVRQRLKQAGGGEAIVADGEKLPLPDGIFDLIVSIGVLEHVRRPRAFLTEAYRVLRPGGCMYLSCENYLSFYEPHYQLAWLPLFPKPLASIYLRLRGRSDEFLRASIYYTTRHGVVRMLRAAGFQFAREARLREKLRQRLGLKSSTPRIQQAVQMFIPLMARIVFELEILRRAFGRHVVLTVQKPPLPSAIVDSVARRPIDAERTGV